MSEAISSWADSRVEEMIRILDIRRKARGLSFRQLVDASGVAFETLHGWRVGERSPWLGTLEAALRALGLRLMIEPDVETETKDPVTLVIASQDNQFWRDFKYQLLLPRLAEMGVPAYKLAPLAGLSPATIYNWERGDRAKIATLLKVLRLIGYTVTLVDESKVSVSRQ